MCDPGAKENTPITRGRNIPAFHKSAGEREEPPAIAQRLSNKEIDSLATSGLPVTLALSGNYNMAFVNPWRLERSRWRGRRLRRD